MNNKTITWAAVVVVVLGGAWYLLSGPQNETLVTAPTADTSTQPAAKPVATQASAPAPSKAPAKIAGVGSLVTLMGMKESLVCSVQTASGLTRSGTLYVAGGKARANFTTGSSMIDDGAYLYAWVNGATTGVKLSAALTASGSAITSNGGVDPATALSYSCNLWTAEMGVFTPPSTVSF